jgi:SNF2 family DNA or RNA helicase
VEPSPWRALHNAFRLTLSHGKGNLSSVDWGRLILEPYQLVPLQRIKNLPFPRILIGDDTGLGKTAEAGLIPYRLMQKRRADRVLILCRAKPEPERWRDEMKEKFGIDLTVINESSIRPNPPRNSIASQRFRAALSSRHVDVLRCSEQARIPHS